MKCSKCGRAIVDSYTFCPHCGNKINHEIRNSGTSGKKEKSSPAVTVFSIFLFIGMLTALITNNFFLTLALLAIVLFLIMISKL